jgi:hypothetical protein
LKSIPEKNGNFYFLYLIDPVFGKRAIETCRKKHVQIDRGRGEGGRGGGGGGGGSEQMSPRYVPVHLYYNSHSRDDMLSMAVVTQTSHQHMHEKGLDVSICPRVSVCVSTVSRSRISVLRKSRCTLNIRIRGEEPLVGRAKGGAQRYLVCKDDVCTVHPACGRVARTKPTGNHSAD